MNILVSGSLAYDRIMDFPGRFSDHILPDKIHILNVCFQINGLRENFGGTAGNIAYVLSLLGERPVVVATAGRDFGPYRSWLMRHGISAEHIKIVEEELTAGAYITTDLADNQITAFNPGAMKHCALFDFKTVPPEKTLAIISPGNLEDMFRFSRLYREYGIRYIFDPGQSLPKWTAGELLEMMTGSMIFIGNDYEIEMTMEKTGLDIPGILERTGALITTRGEYGSTVTCRLADGTMATSEVSAVDPERVNDPTGAGDAYRAGLIKGLLLPGGDIVHAARIGAACAVYSVEVYGTQNFSFTEAEFRERFEAFFGGPPF